MPRDLVPEKICSHLAKQRACNIVRMVKVNAYIEKKGPLNVTKVMKTLVK
jgi:hypothetical protein